MTEGKRIRLKGDNEKVVEMEGDSASVLQYAELCRDVELGNQRIQMEQARRPKKLIEGLVFVLSGGGRRDARREELRSELDRLGLQCEAFKVAAEAIIESEGNRMRQFEAMCQALPSMTPSAQDVALQVLNGLALKGQSLPTPSMPALTHEPEK